MHPFQHTSLGFWLTGCRWTFQPSNCNCYFLVSKTNKWFIPSVWGCDQTTCCCPGSGSRPNLDSASSWHLPYIVSTKLSNSTCDTPGNSTTLRPGSVRRLFHQMVSPYICRAALWIQLSPRSDISLVSQQQLPLWRLKSMEVIQKGLRRIILSKFEFHLQNYKCKATHTYVKQKYISSAE